MQYLVVRILFVVQVSIAITCYESTTTTTPYEFLNRSIVETQKDCEVLCDGNSLCVGFAFKEAGLNSSCVLLKNYTSPNKICSEKATMFLKKSTGCDALDAGLLIIGTKERIVFCGGKTAVYSDFAYNGTVFLGASLTVYSNASVTMTQKSGSTVFKNEETFNKTIDLKDQIKGYVQFLGACGI